MFFPMIQLQLTLPTKPDCHDYQTLLLQRLSLRALVEDRRIEHEPIEQRGMIQWHNGGDTLFTSKHLADETY